MPMAAEAAGIARFGMRLFRFGRLILFRKRNLYQTYVFEKVGTNRDVAVQTNSGHIIET
jgi:hypothetical protein